MSFAANVDDEVDVVVVGAGLAGLACARVLGQAGLEVRVLERGDAVGGRVRTDHVDGYTLDRGFQVLNTGYPELQRVVDLGSLDLRSFVPGVAAQIEGRTVSIVNPLQRPGAVPALAGTLLRLPVGGIRGKGAFGLYASRCVTQPATRLKAREDVAAVEAWRRAGIPTDVVNGVLRPFFAGVLLEQGMTSSRRFTDLMMRMFVVGRSTVPAGGMQRLPEVLAEALPEGCVRLDTPVRRVRARHVESDSGAVAARAVVVATDPWAACDLLGGLADRMLAPPLPRGVTTVYHAAPGSSTSSGVDGMLMLDCDASPVSNTVVLSGAAPEYAPEGRMLVSSSMVHGGALPDPDGPEVRRALARLHGADTSRWEHVATYDLPRAQPGMPAPHPMRRPVRLAAGGDTVYVAGDHRDTSSIQGALVSGRRAAEAVLADLGVTL